VSKYTCDECAHRDKDVAIKPYGCWILCLKLGGEYAGMWRRFGAVACTHFNHRVPGPTNPDLAKQLNELEAKE
jgi:hypothetical protein